MTKQIIPSFLTLRIILCATFAGIGGHGYAQTKQDAPTWYQVEIIIFERLSRGQGGDREVWPKDIELRYPEHWQKLLTPQEAAEVLAETTAESAQEAVVAPPPKLAKRTGAELAFVQLPEAQRDLNQTKGGIARDRALRVLFHEAWRQPILPADEGPSIIVRGGNSYGEHTELEGSIHLSVSRYLHIYTNLWLTQFIPNYGQESEHWPPLPALPERRPALPTTTEDPSLSLEFNDTKPTWNIEPKPLDDYTSLISQPFLIKEIVTLQQTRRMRSGELHYIDHPRLGLLIRIDSYKPDQKD